MARPGPGDIGRRGTGDGISPWRRRLIGWRARLGGLGGWRGRGTLVLLGALAAAAMPPVHLVFLLVPSFVGWLWIIERKTTWRGAFSAGWWYGLGFFGAGLYWVSGAFLVEPEKHAWMIPFAITLLSGGFALFPGMVAMGVRWVPGSGLGRALALAIIWTGAEWVRGWFLTGFPWNLMGTVWVFSDAMIQPAALFGTYGLGLLTVFIASSPAVLGEAGPLSRRAGMGLGIAAALLAAMWLGGEIRVAGAGAEEVQGVRLRLVQPNIRQDQKWKAGHRDRHLALQVAMSRQAGAGPPPTHVIWPETAATFFFGRDPGRRAFFAQAAPPGGLAITGAPRTTPPEVRPYQVWNSLQVLDHTGRIVGTYDKSHLIPFGEYVPFRPWLTIPKVTEGRQDFSAGEGVTSLRLPGLPPVSPLICYEAIFPGAVADPSDRPAWLLNLTNDAWYGITAGPHQHLAIARVRAVEEGVPMIRAANTGISAIIGPYGRVLARLGLTKAGVLDGPLPAPVPDTTIYARFGDMPFLATLALFAVFLGFRHFRDHARP
ncbi:MAG: apolipoprotein N-acyltransferase [Rhodospirillales bacterium]|nr:apolipoprotein N-acyltransferase [Rhodospirillales bacterium]